MFISISYSVAPKPHTFGGDKRGMTRITSYFGTTLLLWRHPCCHRCYEMAIISPSFLVLSPRWSSALFPPSRLRGGAIHGFAVHKESMPVPGTRMAWKPGRKRWEWHQHVLINQEIAMIFGSFSVLMISSDIKTWWSTKYIQISYQTWWSWAYHGTVVGEAVWICGARHLTWCHQTWPDPGPPAMEVSLGKSWNSIDGSLEFTQNHSF